MLTPIVAWLVVLSAAWPQAAGSISGCVADSQGPLPGAELVATGEGSSRVRAVTDADGCFRIGSLRPGRYSLTASLAGFLDSTRHGVVVAPGLETRRVDFKLCVAELSEINWVVPGGPGLSGAWKEAHLVARVRILGTQRLDLECPTSAVVHTAIVEETFKGSAGTVSFNQEIWVEEPKPYEVGEEVVVFLGETAGGLYRIGGPHYVFLLNGDRVVAPASSDIEDRTRDAFLSRLRALAKDERATRSAR